MITVAKIKSIQGRISDLQISGNDLLKKAMLKGDEETKRIINRAIEVSENSEDRDTVEIHAALILLNSVAINQATEETKSMNKKVDWLLDAIGEILISINPKDAGKIGLKIHRLKNPE